MSLNGTPGAKSVPAGALLTTRDIRALRVKVLNTARLHAELVGGLDTLQTEIDKVGGCGVEGVTTGSLLARSLDVLNRIASDPAVKASMRWRAAKTIAEAVRELRRDQVQSKIAAVQLAQRSQEHADQMAIETRKLDQNDADVKPPTPGGAMSLDELRKLRDAAPA